MQPHQARMSHPSVLALGYSEAAMLLRKASPTEVKALISIFGNHEFPLDAPGITETLILRFDDVEAVDPTDPVKGYATWARQKWAAETGRPVSPPEIKDAAAIIDFARALGGPRRNGSLSVSGRRQQIASRRTALSCDLDW